MSTIPIFIRKPDNVTHLRTRPMLLKREDIPGWSHGLIEPLEQRSEPLPLGSADPQHIQG